MIRYTVTDRRPLGAMWHGPDSLALRHIADSLRGVKTARRLHFPWIDNDYMPTKDGVLVCCHSFGIMAKEHFRAAGVPMLPIDRLTWRQVERLRGPHGYRVNRIEWMFHAYAALGVGVAFELKGDGREGWRIATEAYADRIVALANLYGVRLYVKCDPLKAPLVDALAFYRDRGVWTRTNGRRRFTRPS